MQKLTPVRVVGLVQDPLFNPLLAPFVLLCPHGANSYTRIKPNRLCVGRLSCCL
jgi:hypothetical protein